LQPRDEEDSHVPNNGANAIADDEDENRLAQLHGASQIDFLSYMFSQEASDQVSGDYLERGMHTTNQGSTLSYAALRHSYTGPLRFHAKPEADRMTGHKSRWNNLELRSGHVDVAQLLVEHSADPTARNKKGKCPLHFASLSEYVEVTQFLIDHGADPTVQDEDGWTPLHAASLNGHTEVVQFLVDHGADPTVQDEDGWTPLHLASENGDIKVVQFLVEHGADPTARVEGGQTHFHPVPQWKPYMPLSGVVQT
jgi:hypothetical protein